MSTTTIIGARSSLVVVDDPALTLVPVVRVALTEEEVVTALTTGLGAVAPSGIADLACVAVDGDVVRILLGGAGVARVERRDGEHDTLSGTGAAWSEYAYQGALSVVLSVGESRAELVLVAAAGEPLASAPQSAPAPEPEPENVEPEPAASIHTTLIPSPEPARPAVSGSEVVAKGEVRSPSGSAPPLPVPETDGFDFQHLLARTQYVGVEAAAVRPEAEAEEVEDPVGEPPPVTPGGGSLPSAPVPSDPPTASQAPPTPVGSEPAVAETAAQPGAPDDGRTVTFAELGAAVPLPPKPQETEAPPTPVVSEPAVPQTAAQPAAPDDDRTVTLAELRSARSLDDTDSVTAVHCVRGHPNPPTAETCRVCHGAIAEQPPLRIPRPSLGQLHFSDGLVVELDRTQRIGRSPELGDLPGAGLVSLHDPGNELSRTHVEVRIEGWQVLVVDQNSVNGTLVQLPGQAPVKLGPNEPMIMAPGTEVTLGESFRFVFQVAE